ncbi:hypothetical protein T265_09109 [Opisthorchis viverrini]|uniref:Reverse transcriptase domain-containing protein n=1 Tax=Opisthorchis viverrini TaxID=6198 RepID=A0A074ZHY6_OPIVI|nr:hypothetical protein T265_09109 [Opisthorchis viverrini]KER22905.1 hypothetical protein T265_09109 [Opisthorchis viverrini]
MGRSSKKTISPGDCGNYSGISLTPVVTRLLASIVLRRLTVAREILTREQQAGFRPGPALRTDDSVCHASALRTTYARHMAPTSPGIPESIFKPRHPVYLAAFHVCTLKQAGQQAALALTLDSLGIDVCCASETRIQNTSSD